MNSFVPSCKFKRFFRTEDGQVLLLTSVAVGVLLVMAGLGVDAGFLRYQHQQMQKAADAAALAASDAWVYSNNYVAAGRNDAAANGFTDGSNSISVQILVPPTDGPWAGNGSFVEAIVSQPQPAFFMKVGGWSTVPVSARAYAAKASSPGCIFALDPAQPRTYDAGGSGTVQSQCGILDNSGDPGGYYDGGSACTYATSISVVGGGATACGTTPSTGASHFTDPLNYLAEPAVGQAPKDCLNSPPSQKTHITSGQNVTLNAGMYCAGIQIDGGATVTFAPSGTSNVFVLYGGGLTVNSGATLTGSGVMFYNTGETSGKYGYGNIVINGVSNSTLSAPTSGTYAGILFFGDRSLPAQSDNITGGSGTNINGAIYLPNDYLSWAGNSASSLYTILVADTITVTGASYVGDNYQNLPGGLSPIQVGALTD